MSLTQPLLCVGFNHQGDADFAVSASVVTLSPEAMHKLRNALCQAIGTMEHMWYCAQTPRPELRVRFPTPTAVRST